MEVCYDLEEQLEFFIEEMNRMSINFDGLTEDKKEEWVESAKEQLEKYIENTDIWWDSMPTEVEEVRN